MMSKLDIDSLILTDDALAIVLEEFKNMLDSGILVDGEARKIARIISSDYGIEYHHAIQILKDFVLWQVASLWLDSFIQCKQDKLIIDYIKGK